MSWLMLIGAGLASAVIAGLAYMGYVLWQLSLDVRHLYNSQDYLDKALSKMPTADALRVLVMQLDALESRQDLLRQDVAWVKTLVDLLASTRDEEQR